MSEAENPRAVIGDNRTPFELSREEIDDLCLEAKNWLDGSIVTTQEEADAVSRLLELLRKAEKTADERRAAEAKPFDDGKAEVQARYAPLIADTKTKKGKAVVAISACKAALTPFLNKKEAEQRAAAEEARRQAEAAEIAAQKAFAQSGPSDLEAREEAERLAEAAKIANATANRAAKEKPHAKGGSRAIGLRTSYRAEITDESAFAKYVWQTHQAELSEFLATLAQRLVNAKARDIPGVTIHEQKDAA